MATRSPKVATYADLQDLPPEVTGQILAGELFVMPRPGSGHALCTSVLGGDLNGAFQRGRGGPGGWWLLDEPELHLGPDVIVPDLAGWRRERMHEIEERPFFTLAPDWVCEVLSPSSVRIDRVKKPRIYVREAVRWMWLVDPAACTLEVFELDGESYRMIASFEATDRVPAKPFEALELELGALWLPSAR